MGREEGEKGRRGEDEKGRREESEKGRRVVEKVEGKGKLSYKEQRELEALPTRLSELEAEIAEIEAALADASIYARDNARARMLAARLPQAREELDAAETRWLELSERAEPIH